MFDVKQPITCHMANFLLPAKGCGSSRNIDVRKGVLGGLTPSLRLKIWADPPSWKIFEQVTP